MKRNSRGHHNTTLRIRCVEYLCAVSLVFRLGWSPQFRKPDKYKPLTLVRFIRDVFRPHPCESKIYTRNSSLPTIFAIGDRKKNTAISKCRWVTECKKKKGTFNRNVIRSWKCSIIKSLAGFSRRIIIAFFLTKSFHRIDDWKFTSASPFRLFFCPLVVANGISGNDAGAKLVWCRPLSEKVYSVRVLPEFIISVSPLPTWGYHRLLASTQVVAN